MPEISTGIGGVTVTGLVGGNVTTNVDQSSTVTLTGSQIGAISGELGKIIAAAKDSPAAAFAPEKIAELEKAKTALDGGDGAGALRALKASGAWLLDFATKVGQAVAAQAIKTQLGI